MFRLQHFLVSLLFLLIYGVVSFGWQIIMNAVNLAAFVLKCVSLITMFLLVLILSAYKDLPTVIEFQDDEEQPQ